MPRCEKCGQVYYDSAAAEGLSPNDAEEVVCVFKSTLDKLQASLDKLHGAPFSDRCYHALVSRAETAEQAASIPLDQFDAGLLGDYGGGDINWWQSYIRNLLNEAHEYYISQQENKSPE